MNNPVDWSEILPTGPEDQSCAFCDGLAVTWVHPLDQDHVRFRKFGKEHTLPHFWTVCDRCEQLYRLGDVEAVVELMTASDGWGGRPDVDVDEEVRQPLAVFTRADLGPRPLTG